jgi:hypothetical protein
LTSTTGSRRSDERRGEGSDGAVDYAKDPRNGKVVAAEDASRWLSYACPRPGCGGRVFLRDGGSRRAHFAHHAGEGTEACDEYFPSVGGGGGEAAAPVLVSAVEDSPSELGLIVDQLDGEWRLGLRLPEIPREELGDISLSALRQASVEVSVGGTVVSRISALDLRSGVSAARVPVRPAVQEYRARAVGSWPRTINTERWQLQARGIDAKGTLFRLRGGEWTRLLSGSGVHHGERLFVLADDRSVPPARIVTETHARISTGGGSRWTLWEVQIPDEPVASVTAWIERLGHVLVPRPWSIELATPPRVRAERGEPVFWVGDAPVVALAAPQGGAEALVWFRAGTNSMNARVKAAESRSAFVAIKSQDVGPTRLTAVAERSADIDVTFVQRPPRAALLELLTKTPRVRVWIGEVAIEAWRGSECEVLVARAQPEVRVDLGAEDARARVTVWDHGKQRSSRGLDARNAARVIEAALPTASRIELDADNFGRMEIVLARAAAERHSRSSESDRLAWYDHVASLSSPPEEHSTPTIIEQPRISTSLAVRRVGAAALVRSRQALRRRQEAGGDR